LETNDTPIDLVDIWMQDFRLSKNTFFEGLLILIFDAINENSQPEDLLSRISHRITFSCFSFVKVIIVCRNPSWRILKDYLQLPQMYIYEPFPLIFELEVREFTVQESLVAFENHAAVIGFPQSFEELSVQARDFIRYPLFLGLATKIFGKTDDPIPKNISLRQLFNQYVNESIGVVREDPRYLIIERMLVYLFDLRQRAVDVSILRNDSIVGHLIVLTDRSHPYQQLLEGGFLTHQQKIIGARKEFEQVFITYERIFEYLLADLVLNPEQPISTSEIESLVQSLSLDNFPSLIGALELAISYRMIDSPNQRNLIIALAASPNLLTRQLVTDALHTIYIENSEFAQQIIREMCFESDTNIRITACDISFSLGLFEQLIALALSKHKIVSYVASYYIYRLWDDARQRGDLEGGYKYIQTLAEYSKYPKVLKTRLVNGQRALFALFSVSAHMMKHLLSTPEHLSRLGEIISDTLRSVPGIDGASALRGALGAVSEMLTVMGVQLVSILTFRPDVIFSNKNAMNAFYQNRINGDAISQMFHSVLDYPTLQGHELEIGEIISGKHPIVPWMSAGVLIYHSLEGFEHTIGTINYLFEHGDFHSRFWATYTLEATTVIHISKGDNRYLEILPYLYDFALAMWEDRDDPELVNLATGPQVDTTEILLLVEAMQNSVFGNVAITSFLDILTSQIDTPLTLKDIERILKYCELIAYQGYPEYSLKLLFSKFHFYWENTHKKETLQILSAIRSIYREEFDAFRSRSSSLDSLWSEIQTVATTADINSLWHANANLWLIGVYSSKTLLKVAYLSAMTLVDATSSIDFFRKVVRLILEVIRDTSQIDILVVQRHLQYASDWNRIDIWEIPEQVFAQAVSDLDAYDTGPSAHS
ncbi:hypothetical protein KC909_05955, partial [Candidatus Dojkabacteria bacterium]|nr:hypothetical protein [Candidatus Dojkabacteria bacterium]